MTSRRLLRLLAVPATVALLLSGCASAPEPETGFSLPAADVSKNQQLIALYVEQERAQLPEVLTLYPDVYDAVVVQGSLVEGGPSDAFSGAFADIHFEYVFAEEREWDAVIPELEAARGQFDSGCAEDVFPNLQQAGISVPIALTYKYSDVTLDSWQFTHTCTSE